MKPVFLSGGLGPWSWFRGMSRAVAPLQALRRSTAWLGQMAATRPRLRDEPLLGRSFAELALRELPARSPEPQAARSGGRRSVSTGERALKSRSVNLDEDLPDRLKLHRRREALTTPTPPLPAALPPFRERRGSANPFHLEPRAGRALLVHRAGGIPNVLRDVAPDVSQNVARDVSRATEPAPPLLRPVSTRPASDLATGPAGPGARREWLRDLGRRAVRALLRSFPEAAGRRTLPGGSADSSVAAPAEPWETDLEGERAPADLLKEWTAPVRGASSGAARPEGPAPADPGRTAPPARRPDPPRPEAISAPVPLNPAPPPPGPAGDIPAPTADAPALSVAGLLDAALPPLLPPRDSGPSSPWKAPAQAPAIVGRLEAEVPEEDLGRLAASIQRILDEEARRHGIDV